MPYKDAETYRAYHVQYRAKHRAESLLWQAEYRKQNRIELREIAKQRRKKPGEKEKLAAYRQRDYVKENRYFDNALATYSITRVQYQRLWTQQKGRCVICGQKFQSRLDAHIDHDHTARKVRGLLCAACNNGLGRFKESIPALKGAITYLRLHNANPFT